MSHDGPAALHPDARGNRHVVKQQDRHGSGYRRVAVVAVQKTRMPLKIRPFVSAGEPILHGDGRTFDVLPISVFRMSTGGTVIRIGLTTLWFSEDGSYEGPELRADKAMSEAEGQRLVEALDDSRNNLGCAPDVAYFTEGTSGYIFETANWPKRQTWSN